MSSKQKISQSGIRNENIIAIFNEIAGSDGISRSEISERTGLSLMTVGKVADLMTHEGIAHQAKPATGNAGRRAGMLTLLDSHFILSLDISGESFRATALNLALVPFDSVSYRYNDSLAPEDNLIIFYREACSLLMKHLMSKKLSGMGICIPGDYDEESDTVKSQNPKRLVGLKIATTLKNATGLSPDKIMNSNEATAISVLSTLSAEDSECTVNLSLDSGAYGCITIDGEVLHRPSDFESLLCDNGKTLGYNLADITDEEYLSRLIGSALKPVISVICPDSVFISASERTFTEWFPTFLERELTTKGCRPKIIFENSRKSHSDMGIAYLLREAMLKNL